MSVVIKYVQSILNVKCLLQCLQFTEPGPILSDHPKLMYLFNKKLNTNIVVRDVPEQFPLFK